MYTDLNNNDTTLYQKLIKLKEDHKQNILILEDDYTFKPLWTSVIKHCLPYAHIDWVETEEAAERCIKLRRNREQKYDLIISDIFLSGRKTGIDLWTRYADTTDHFIFVSSLSREIFDGLVQPTERHYPIYLKKPLRASLCIDVIRKLMDIPTESQKE